MTRLSNDGPPSSERRGSGIEVFAVPDDDAAVMAVSGRHPEMPGHGNTSLVVGEGRPERVRAEILGAIGLDVSRAVFMEQVHGNEVARVSNAAAGRGAVRHGEAIPGVDALVTHELDLALVVQAADCVPVLLVEPGRGVAAVHAGRRGVEADVIGAALAAMEPLDPAVVIAWIGPAIGSCCYEVPASVAAGVEAVVAEAAGTTTWGTPSLDLPGAVRRQLAEAGVSRVAAHGGCTRCESDRWFSHRAAPGQGRQAAMVARLGVGAAPPDHGRALGWAAW